jgi:hypothetical protein
MMTYLMANYQENEKHYLDELESKRQREANDNISYSFGSDFGGGSSSDGGFDGGW